MTQRISDEQLATDIEQMSPLCLDRSGSCIHCDELEIMLDLRDARDKLRVAEAALEFYEDRPNYPLAVESLAHFKAVKDMGTIAREALRTIRK